MKKSSRPISKKCSRAELSARTAPVFAVLLLLASNAADAAPIPAKPTLESLLRSEIEEHAKTKRTSFQTLLDRWQKLHGLKAVPIAQKIASDKTLKDQSRYIGMMAAVRLGGENALPAILKHSADKSWMVRSGVLKSIELTHSAQGTRTAEKLLKDPALVIRTQAVETLIELNPPNLKDLLMKSVFDPINYRGGSYKKGRAEWVPQRALAGLRKIQAKNVSSKLMPLLSDASDPKLRAHALFTIEALEGRKLEAKGSFEKRAKAWAKHFSKSPASASKSKI